MVRMRYLTVWTFGLSQIALAGTPLFTLERSLNRNEVVYDAQLGPKGFDPRIPIHAYWKMNEKGGAIEELNGIEKSKAYGTQVVDAQSRQIKFTLSAMPRLIITAKIGRGPKSVPHAYVNLNDQEVEVRRFYLHLETGGLTPRLKFVVLSGRRVEKNKKPGHGPVEVSFNLYPEKDDNFRVEPVPSVVDHP
jgi:hypothetical protein